MSGGMWFVVCIPKKDYEIKCGKVFVTATSIASSKESLAKKSETSTVPNGAPKTPEPETTPSAKDPQSASQTSLPKSVDKSSEYSDMVYFADKRGPLEEMMKDALTVLGVVDAVWCSEKNDKFYQVYFPCESGSRCDHILRVLAARGIGYVNDSTVAVLPCAVFYQERSIDEDDDEELSDTEPETNEEPKEAAPDKTSQPSVKSKSGGDGKETKSKSMKGFKAMQQQFLKSVTARLTVAQVVESVRGGAQLTFDFMTYVVLASLIAAFGLMESSSVTIVAAMLVSPIMGPIIAGTFGVAIRDKSLILLGLRTEAIGLSTCLTLGIIIGLICGNFSEDWGANPFPTPEMAGRGQTRSLWVGVLIALPSGAGVALSILGGNAGSLVGVAISASLLPPTVNAGMLWGMGAIKRIQSWSHEDTTVVIKDKTVTINEALLPPKGYEFMYKDTMDKECAILGIVSFFLTIVNICCIIVSALLVLKIKEVAPNASVNATKRFWKQDIKIARDYNKTLSNKEASQMGQQFLSEWANLNGISPNEVMQDSKTQYQTLQDMINDVEDDDVYRSILSYVPQSQRVTMDAFPSRPSYGNTRVSDIESGYSTSSPVTKAINKRRHTRFNDTMESPDHESTESPTPHTASDPDFTGVRLRHQSAPHLRINPMLRRSLQSAASPPYSLWPSRNKLRRLTSSRFVVTPVEDPLPPLPPRFRKNKNISMESNI